MAKTTHNPTIKKCQGCNSPIALDSSRCPYCGKQQSSFIANVLKVLIVVVLLVIGVLIALTL